MKLYTVPSTRAALKVELRNNARLGPLWYRVNDPSVNASSTLPQEIQSKEQINERVAIESKAQGMSLKWKQTYAYAKALMHFYKHGVSSVWNNYFKEYRALRKNFMLTNIDNLGVQQSIKIPSFTKLTQEMAQQLYILDMERNAQKQIQKDDANMIKRVKSPTEADGAGASAFNLSRHQYQILHRTPKDFVKIPSFAIIFMIFVETTPVLCYLLPEITPLTCVLPNILPRLWSPKASIQLRDLRIKDAADLKTTEEAARQTAFNLPLAEVKLLIRTLRLKSKYVPTFMFPETVLRRRLQTHYNYLKVDDSFLSKNGNVWNLTEQELLLCCLERNIVLDIKQDSKLFGKEYFDELRLKLLRWLADFPDYNVGYIGLNHVLGEESVTDTKLIMNLWREDNKS